MFIRIRCVCPVALTILFCTSAWTQTCDLALPSGTIDEADVQAAINMTLGKSACTANIVGAGICNVVVVQRVVNASLPGGICRIDSGSTISHSSSLSWTASNSSGVTGYNIYRKTGSAGTFTKLTSSPVAGTTYTDNSVQAGQTYYYVATAIGSTGLESSHSNQVIAAVPSP